MRISQQIGWSQESKLIYQIVQQTEKLNNQFTTGQPAFKVPVSKQIGLSNESNLYYEWLTSLSKLTSHYANCCTPTTTTTTTTIPPEPGDISIAASSDFDITGDFTIEFFMNMANTDGFPRVYSFSSYPSAKNAISIEGGGSILYFWANNSPLIYAVIPSSIIDVWTHVAIVGEGSLISIYINGNREATGAYGGSISSAGFPLVIGSENAPNTYFNGYLSNFRWNSTALYSGPSITVPTAPLPNITGNKLLIFQGDNLPLELSDNSGNGHNATNNGAVYSANNPFSPTYEGSLQMGVV